MADNESIERLDVQALQSALSDAGASWQAAPNFLTELPAEERKLYLGFTPPGDLTLEALEERAKAAMAEHQAGIGAVGYPASFDWRNYGGQNYITSVKNQGACGSCVAFGTTAAVEGTFRVQRANPNLAVDLSEASLFYCIAASQGRNCSTGWWPQNALTGYQTTGVSRNGRGSQPVLAKGTTGEPVAANWSHQASVWRASTANGAAGRWASEA